MRSIISDFLHKLVVKVYFQTSVQKVAQSIGVNHVLKRTYEWTQSQITHDVAVINLEENTLKFELVSGTPASHVHDNFKNENTVFEDISNSIQSDDVFYDIGAYIGTYAAFAGISLDKGEVHAFEPLTKHFSVLERNFEHNDIPGAPHNIALSNSGHIPEGLSNHTQAVTTMQGDDYIESNRLPTPDIVKIDVEGAEGKVVEGLSNTLSSDSCRLVYIETHPIELMGSGLTDNEIEEMKEKLQKYGFSIEMLHKKEKWKNSGELVDQQFLKAEK